MKTKYIFVTGGVLSSLGKGLSAASLAALLENRGLKISLMKMDPYLNVDPGTMNPFQHGEVFVTEDGAETDLDLGHYERFTNVNLKRENSITAGQVYETVIAKERRGEFLGGTVQVIPHITDEIKERIRKIGKEKDVAIVEIGGTVGDIESLPFLEAIRQFRFDVGEENVCFIHLTLVPYLGTSGELKTKPTQHSVQKLREIGIQPDFLLCRTDRILPPDIRGKIALFCNLQAERVITAKDVSNIYEVPLVYFEQGLDEKVCKRLGLKAKSKGLEKWAKIVQTLTSPSKGPTEIGIVGKYVDLTESYKSVSEALVHGAIANNCKLSLRYIDSEKLEKETDLSVLKGLSGILVPGGFGNRGVEGKIRAIQYARENKIPYFGICIGLQLAIIEYSRHVCGLNKATSREFSTTGEFVIDLMEDQRRVERVGGSMRLGSYACELKMGSQAEKAYGKSKISERHRHRYEFNNHYKTILEDSGMVFSGMNPETGLVEMMEIPNHPWFVTCQFHPEFKSKPFLPHPLFVGFVKAAVGLSLQKRKEPKTKIPILKKKSRSDFRISARN
ncbi:MAG: CTP synthase [Proteobacteria bacterium]|nr:CTP synthase [Pseudomonadota bacterium]NDD04587.1 CTP synthase [Pseudomonadota bacterium]NDG26282.1 CTP synthase [Pseudomonadota bacterium]